MFDKQLCAVSKVNTSAELGLREIWQQWVACPFQACIGMYCQSGNGPWQTLAQLRSMYVHAACGSVMPAGASVLSHMAQLPVWHCVVQAGSEEALACWQVAHCD